MGVNMKRFISLILIMLALVGGAFGGGGLEGEAAKGGGEKGDGEEGTRGSQGRQRGMLSYLPHSTGEYM